MTEDVLRKYARLAVCSGVNVQPDQLLVINASVKDHEFVEMCVEEGYKAGAKEVYVNWNDENISKMHYQYQSIETLSQFPDWREEKTKYEQANKACYLSIDSSTPGLMKDIDQEKIKASLMAYYSRMAKYQKYTMNNIGQWSVIALPSPAWAKMIFPEKSEEEAVEALWDAILFSVRVREDNDPVEEWRLHDEELDRHCQILNSYQFDALHFESELGTDLTVNMVKDHIWVGGGVNNPDNVFFNPNMPTEECFCMPDRDNVNGIVHASKPLDYNGTVIKDFWFRFENGKVVDYDAAEGKEALTTLLETDEGSRHLGEVALISYDSPISNLDILFYNTLFDENASCHLALGACYPENITGGLEMETEELLRHGGNDSLNHVDFMFGTRQMKVTGIKENKDDVIIFENGNFVF